MADDIPTTPTTPTAATATAGREAPDGGTPPPDRPVRVGRGARRAWKVLGAVVTVPVLLFGFTQVAGTLAHEERTEVSTVDADGLRVVEIGNDDGSIRVVGAEGATRVTVTARISDGWRDARHELRREGDRLVVDADCPEFLAQWCNVRYTVEVPATLAVMADSGNGSVTVTDVAGDVEASSGNGSVELARIAGDVVLHTGNGSVRSSDLRSATADASSGNGRVQLEFAEPPRRVVADSGNGSVEVVLPRTDDLYRVEADSGNGTVSTSGVGTLPTSSRSITATSGNGDVTITYALD